MSRSGYMEGGIGSQEEQWAHIRYRGAVTSAFRGKRGQSFLREALLALEEHADGKLISSDLEAGGCYCTLGAVGAARGLDMSRIDPYDVETVSGKFDVAEAMAREIVYENDEGSYRPETPEQRYQRMHRYLSGCIENKED